MADPAWKPKVEYLAVNAGVANDPNAQAFKELKGAESQVRYWKLWEELAPGPHQRIVKATTTYEYVEFDPGADG